MIDFKFVFYPDIIENNNLWCESVNYIFYDIWFSPAVPSNMTEKTVNLHELVTYYQQPIKEFRACLDNKIQEQCKNLNINGSLFCFFKTIPFKFKIVFETKEQAEYFYLMSKLNPIKLTV